MKSEWIPIKREQPPIGVSVMISCEFKGHKWLTLGFLAEQPDYGSPEEDATYTEWILQRDLVFVDADCCVKAWMPLPEFYEESEENENA